MLTKMTQPLLERRYRQQSLRGLFFGEKVKVYNYTTALSNQHVFPGIECSLFTRQNPSYVIFENMVTNSTESTMDELTGES